MKRGFTLIEILIILLIIGIISLITVPIVTDIITNSKKEAFRKNIEGLVRKYENKEVNENVILGSVDACDFQETCEIEGIVKRDNLGNIRVYATNGTYCVNGDIDITNIIDGTCGINEEKQDKLSFESQTININYDESKRNISLKASGGSNQYVFTKISEIKENIDNDTIEVTSDGVIKIPDKIDSGEYDLVIRVQDIVTNEVIEKKVKLIVNKIDISNLELNSIPSFEYDGFSKKPEPEVIYNGIVLEKEKDFEYSYENNKNVGTAILTVTGIGNYIGSVSKTFIISNKKEDIKETKEKEQVKDLSQTEDTNKTEENKLIDDSNQTPKTRNTKNINPSMTITSPTIINIPSNPSAKTYNGNIQESGIICPTGSVVSGIKQAKDVGIYTQTCTLIDTTNYKWSDNTTTPKNISWSINRLNTATKGSCNNLIYNGNIQTLVSGGSYVSYTDNSGKNVGEYTVIVDTDNNHSFSDGEITKSITCKINPQTLTIPVSPSFKTYSGISQNSNITCPTGSIASGMKQAINAGTYTQTCTLSSTTNYKWNDNTTTPKNVTWTINRLNTATTGSCIARTYNGSSQTLVNAGNYVSYSSTTGVNAGDYNITVTTDNNHSFSDGTISKTLPCKISAQTLTVPTSPSARSYTGGTIYSNITCPTGSNTSGTTSAVNAGNYTQTCALSNTTNYKWNDNTTSTKNIGWVINKINPTMNLSSYSGTIKTTSTGSITVTGSNYGTLSCSSSNNSIATCSVSDNIVTITPKAVGTVAITVYGTNGSTSNYNSISKTYAATIELGYRCTEGTLTYDATKGYICTKAGIYTSCYSYISQTCNNYSENEAGRRACNESIPNTCDSHCYTYDDGKTRYTRCDDGYMSCVGDHTRAVNACYSRYLDRQWDCSYCVGGYTCDSNWIHYSGSYGSSNLVCYKLATS